MKRYVLLLVALATAFDMFAGTPAEALVDEYKEVKGARNLIAKGAMMNMARPLLKKYSIAPLAHKVEEMSVLRMDKVSPDLKEKFLSDLQNMLGQYLYAGQSDTNNGVVDAYVHLVSTEAADELVVYNPAIYALYSLTGDFSAEELKKIQKKP